MKEVLSNHDYEEGQTGSPRMVIKLAYNKEIALDIINKTKLEYVVMFKNLKSEIEKRWI